MICRAWPLQLQIDWCSFSWESFAGLLAVAGAIYIGWRQIGISRAQAKQIETSADREFSHRQQIDLFDRRAVFYDEFRELWHQWSGKSDLNDPELVRLKALFHQAELLYSERISSALGEALFQIVENHRYADRARDYCEQGNEASAERDRQKSYLAADAAVKLLQPLLQIIKDASRIHSPLTLDKPPAGSQSPTR